ncbi:NAD(P)/FAD-dependent oxidoreductase [Williamsia muralis]|uniref:NAD(P)/FAD-dependent oxidoreductase n=1 Tax=Williamsia marianensis TaxID=85044 RepID=UPI00382D66E1
MTQLFDVVVVGARCAGSPLAVMLARRGLRVCVVDKANFPSETPSTHVIQPCGVAVLERIGVLAAVLGAGGVPIDRFTLVNEDVRIDGDLDSAVFTRPGLCVRRLTLDALLVAAAEDAGAHVRTGVKVTGLLHSGDRVAGVDTDQGPIQASLVVGADGRHSTIAASAGAQEYLAVPGGRTPAWAYFEGVSDRTGRLRLGRVGENAYLASPTDAGLYMACVATGRGFGKNRDEAFGAAIAGWPELADLVAGAQRVGPIRVMTKWHSYFRQAAGPGWVLLGDAGHFKDFTLAQGISDALRQAEHLADALPADLSDHRSLDAATQQWWRWRDDDAQPMYWFATDTGVPGPPTPLVTEVLREVAANPTATLTLLQILNHEINPTRLLTPKHLAAATARALRKQPALTIKEVLDTVRKEIRRTRWKTAPGG